MKHIMFTWLLAVACSLGPTALALTTVDENNLLFIKQEEKVARDVYRFLYAQWGHAAFGNIAVSEQRHMDAVDGLIARNRLSDTTPAELGKFTIPELQALYDRLVATGSRSLEDALAVGALVEETDIADLDEILGTTRDSAIQRVLTNLRNGSYHHLDAFRRAIDQLTALADTVATDGTANQAVETCNGSGRAGQTAAPPQGTAPRQRGRR